MREAIGVVTASAVIGTVVALTATSSTSTAVAIVAATVFVLVAAQLDGWQRIYAITLLLLSASTSSFDAISQAAYYPRFALLALLALWSFKAHGFQRRRLRDLEPIKRWLVRSLWLAVGASILSTAWSVDRLSTISQALALATLAATVHALITNRWRDSQRIAADLSVGALTLSALFAAGIAGSLLGLLTTAAADSPFAPARFRGIYENPNTLGITAAIVAPILWGLWCHTRRRLYLAALIPTVLSLLMCESRSAIVAVVFAFAWSIFRGTSGRATPIMVTAATAASVYALSSVGMLDLTGPVSKISERFTINGGNGLLTGRTVAWSDALNLWQQNPVGYGYATGPGLFENLFASGVIAFSSDVVHNSYLQWLLEVGVVGLVPLIALLITCGVVLVRGRIDGLWAGLVPAVLAGLLVQVTESSMFGTGAAYPLLFWLAVAGAVAAPPQSPIQDRSVWAGETGQLHEDDNRAASFELTSRRQKSRTAVQRPRG